MFRDDPTETVFIGDIHGHASTLLAMLHRLGWKTRDRRLAGPPGQKLVFLGDLIDDGTENLRTLSLVHDLVERGEAVCTMGNHEYNAVQFHTRDPERPGEHLRPRIEQNFDQHRTSLAEIGVSPRDWTDILAWFRRLPLAVEGPGWRGVHACWHPPSLEALEYRDGGWHLPDHRWAASARPDEPEYQAVEHLLKGPEYRLPDGASYHDQHGHIRHATRIRWWEPEPKTLREALDFTEPPAHLDLDVAYDLDYHPGYPEDEIPVFFAHYWRTGEIRPERPNAACLDYSLGRKERLVAYRWRGERRIDPERYVVQPYVPDRQSTGSRRAPA
ncbi:MAG: metallophosphoesterase [Candidatus Wenzhouxiangella sp. M2_3B_020]